MTRRGKERIWAVEGHILAEMAAAEEVDVAVRAAAEEEAICARIFEETIAEEHARPRSRAELGGLCHGWTVTE